MKTARQMKTLKQLGLKFSSQEREYLEERLGKKYLSRTVQQFRRQAWTSLYYEEKPVLVRKLRDRVEVAFTGEKAARTRSRQHADKGAAGAVSVAVRVTKKKKVALKKKVTLKRK